MDGTTHSPELDLESHLPRLTARGVILSLLVSNHPARPTPAQVVRAAGAFDIKESAARAALSRMVTGGDLIRVDDGFTLSAPLLERRQRVLHEVEQVTRPWDGDWEIVVVTGVGRDPGDRAILRSRLSRLRLAELREGVWMRPANLIRPLDLADQPVQRFRAVPTEDGAALVAQLWDLEGWDAESRRLLALMDVADTTVDRFTVATAIVRHLLTDPVLPSEMLPPAWSAARVHLAWANYQEEFVAIPEVGGSGED
ncbi:PaaX family transcriptional regulator C-terminal domain-containing protein [Rhodococcus sp. ARC_M6]|uniref:PaaX family transcriptional regulator C-terminal domain-containing protein n=1 Tax=Rhodococcus sp. ARC_M6 TaxID=2928852 RepID=UPI001FB24A7B|nr:PaaX family transcriptional regulator C-terminal domain-containing protein [Rhodococcus sp. ARC_M6]MCJ0906830.1 PaaX domain-containing protein, C- domain protein [Rhodococcus sp. ARC_M6]